MRKVKGVKANPSANSIKEIAATYTGNPKIQNLYTDIDGKLVPPKWLIMVALNLQPDDLISYTAVDILNRLDFQTYSNRRFDSQKLHKIRYKPISY